MFEMVVFVSLIIPMPFDLKRKLFIFISENPLVAKLQYGLKVCRLRCPHNPGIAKPLTMLLRSHSSSSSSSSSTASTASTASKSSSPKPKTKAAQPCTYPHNSPVSISH